VLLRTSTTFRNEEGVTMPTDPPVPRGNLAYQRRQAQRVHQAVYANDPSAREFAVAVLGPRAREDFDLRDAEQCIAAEHGFADWDQFRAQFEGRPRPARSVTRVNAMDDVPFYEELARQLRADMAAGNPEAERRVQAHLHAAATGQLARGAELPLYAARVVIAHEYGYATWRELVEDVIRRRQELVTPAESQVAQAVQLLRTGDASGLRELLAREPQLVNLRTRPCGETLLGMVAMPNALGKRVGQELGVDARCVAALVDAGADLDGPLNLAAAHDRVELIRILLSNGARAGAIDETYGITALQAAIYHGATAAGDALAEIAVAPMALYVVAGAGRVDLLSRFFDDNGALKPEAYKERMNLADIGWPPRQPPRDDSDEVLGDAFILACYNGRIDTAGQLLNLGANIDAAPYLEVTGLHLAAIGGQSAMVQWLLQNGADATRRDALHGGTAADWARHLPPHRASEARSILSILRS
jgi:Ankyrin repeats (many copies)